MGNIRNTLKNNLIKVLQLLRAIFIVAFVYGLIGILLLLLFSGGSYLSDQFYNSFEDNQETYQTKEDNSNDDIESTIDKYVRDSILSLDYEEEQKEDLNTDYELFFTYDRDIKKSKLVLIDSIKDATTVKEFSDYSTTLTTNYTLPTFEYGNYLVFSIDPRVFGCTEAEGDWCIEYVDQIEKDSVHAGIYRLDLNSGDLKRLVVYNSNGDEYKRFYPIKYSPYILITEQREKEGSDHEYQVTQGQLLNIETEELQTIFSE